MTLEMFNKIYHFIKNITLIYVMKRHLTSQHNKTQLLYTK